MTAKTYSCPKCGRDDGLIASSAVPLCDDVQSSCSKFRFWWMERVDRHRGALRKSLRRQLRTRPPVWGLGLWGNVECEMVARKCAEIIELATGCRSSNFIPDDPIEMIVGLDGEAPEFWLDDIEREFHCDLTVHVCDDAIPNEDVRQLVTFGDLVHYVCEHQDSLSKEEMDRRYRVKWGCVVPFGLTVIVWVFLGVRELIESFQAASFRMRLIILGLVSSPFLGVVVLLVVDLLRSRIAVRKARGAERK